MTVRVALLAGGAWMAANVLLVALIVRRELSRQRDASPVLEAPDGGDPLDSLDPMERELFLEAWWHDVLAMPENELDKPELAYLEWVHNLPEAVA